jgi:hypothetical protein
MSYAKVEDPCTSTGIGRGRFLKAVLADFHISFHLSISSRISLNMYLHTYSLRMMFGGHQMASEVAVAMVMCRVE